MAEYGQCGKCNREYETKSGYLNHVCPVTGFTPTDPEHNGEQFVKQAQAALIRGGSSEDDPEVQELKAKEKTAHAVGNNIRRANRKQLEGKWGESVGPPEFAGDGSPPDNAGV